MTKSTNEEQDPEIVAISAVYAATKGLDTEAQGRVLRYVAAKLKLAPVVPLIRPPSEPEQGQNASLGAADTDATEPRENTDGDIEGISPVARRWIARNGLQEKELSAVFSLGVDEIDLIAKTVPGKNKKARMRSVFLLKGVAAYLGSGAARFSFDQVKEACLHYDAFDSANFASYLKSLSSEVSGSRDTGFALTPRGLADATELVKEVLSSLNAA